jgi:hypothetical protein
MTAMLATLGWRYLRPHLRGSWRASLRVRRSDFRLLA